MKYLDVNQNILEWTSEAVVIPYKSPLDNKFHKYYVDNSIVYRINESTVKKILELNDGRLKTKPRTYLYDTLATRRCRAQTK